jgi:hypothetical protein
MYVKYLFLILLRPLSFKGRTCFSHVGSPTVTTDEAGAVARPTQY